MKKLFLLLTLLCFAPHEASAQCNGLFQPGTACGNNTASPAVPTQVPLGSLAPIPTYTCSLNAAVDTPGLQAAVTAAEASSSEQLNVYGKCALNACIVVTGNLSLIGSGSGQTIIYPTTFTYPAFCFNPVIANRAYQFRGFQIAYPTVPTAGGVPALDIGNATYNNLNFILDDVIINNAQTGVRSRNTINLFATRVYIQYFWQAGMDLSNDLLPDSGGATITDTQIINNGTLSTGSQCIAWASGGGIVIANSKILSCDIGIAIRATGQTTQYQINSNLLGYFSTAGISITRAGNWTFPEFTIANNIFDTTRAIYIPSDAFAPAPWLFNLSIANNVMSTGFNDTNPLVTINNVKGFTVTGNVMLCNGTCTRAMNIAANSSYGLVMQPTNIRPGTWSNPDIVSSTNTSIY